MVIDALKKPSQTQEELYKAAHKNGQKDPKDLWNCPPDGLEKVLESGAELSRTAVELAEFSAEMAITRRLVWSLFQHSVPPVALIYGRDHWVVVADYEITGNPSGPSDNGYDIRAIHIHNPWLSEGEDDPPTTALPEVIPIEEWLADYLQGVEKGHWQGKRVAVGVFTE
jgi:hypothetical protein